MHYSNGQTVTIANAPGRGDIWGDPPEYNDPPCTNNLPCDCTMCTCAEHDTKKVIGRSGDYCPICQHEGGGCMFTVAADMIGSSEPAVINGVTIKGPDGDLRSIEKWLRKLSAAIEGAL